MYKTICFDGENYGRAGQAISNNIKRYMRAVCWITWDRGTHSECVIFTVFRRQLWLRELTSLRYTTLFDLLYLLFLSTKCFV